jgi:Uma2 family endonuclease
MSRDSVVSMSRPAAHVAPSPHRFTREEYHRMGEAGLFANERVELLDGTIVTMAAQNSSHAGTVHRLQRQLLACCGAAIVRSQLPIILDDWSEPEPDVAVCAPDPHDYTREHPRAEQVLLVCEVAISSLSFDRLQKAAAYAGSGIAEYWIVDVESRAVHVLSEPDLGERRYRHERRAGDGDVLAVPGNASLAVSDVLPPL